MSKSEVLLFVHVYKYNDAHLSANAGIIWVCSTVHKNKNLVTFACCSRTFTCKILDAYALWRAHVINMVAILILLVDGNWRGNVKCKLFKSSFKNIFQ
jgi:hypothetical protein